MLDRIRDRQLYAAGIEEENGLGKNLDPGWENVGDACIEIGNGLEVMMSSQEKKMCERPEKYLFWNEMHLGPSAHRLMATEIYHGIDGKLLNHTEAAGMPEGSESGSGSGASPELDPTLNHALDQPQHPNQSLYQNHPQNATADGALQLRHSQCHGTS